MKAILKPDYEQLGQYIKGTLEGKSRMAVEKLLREERTWFDTHLELKEALLLDEGGETAPAPLREKIHSDVKRERIGFVSILIAVVKEKIIVSSAGDAAQDFQPGPVTFARAIGERTLTITLTPLKKKDTFALAVSLEDRETVSVALSLDGVELEKLADLGEQGAFQTQLPTPSSADLVFVAKNKEEFVVNLKLRNNP